MATSGDSNRPLFQKVPGGGCVNMRASIGGKKLNDGNNVNVFAGEFALNNPLGTFWPDFVQAGALVLSVGEDAEVGGCDRVKITANGNAISLDPAYTWKNVGSDSIGTTAANVNIIIALKVSATEINYSVKLN